ncbi:pilin [Patescibacteria group bacterium]|nr:pilin [Patescibacteria group bacterium]
MELKQIIKSSAFRELLIFSGLLGVALIVSTLISDMTFATSLISSDDNISAISGATGGEGDIKSLAKTILNFFLGFLGFVATVMVIYGGVLYVTSAGNEENVQKAKKILMYAVVGIVIILISFALINTILGAGLGGASTTTTG